MSESTHIKELLRKRGLSAKDRKVEEFHENRNRKEPSLFSFKPDPRDLPDFYDTYGDADE